MNIERIDRAYPRVYEALRLDYDHTTAKDIIFSYARDKCDCCAYRIVESVRKGRRLMTDYHGRLGGRG